MIKKIIPIFLLLLSILFVNINEVNGLQTYVGVKIINLTDAPSSSSCAGSSGYGSQGRIRAISSILPDFPIYFELRRISDNSLIWSGNDTIDHDYGIGDIIQIPELVNLSLGVQYKLFMDIDAIKIYLDTKPDTSYGIDYSETGIYWTVGKVGVNSNYENLITSNLNNCDFDSYYDYLSQSSLFFISKYRDPSRLINNCMTDSIAYNCGSLGILGVPSSDSYPDQDYKINGKYNNLYKPNVGNFNIIFALN